MDLRLRHTGAQANPVLPMDTVSDQVRAVGMRLAFDLAHVAILAVGSIGAFLVFDWPPLLGHIVLAYLIAVLILRFALVAGRFLLAPWLAGARAPSTAGSFR